MKNIKIQIKHNSQQAKTLKDKKYYRLTKKERNSFKNKPFKNYQ